MIILGPPGKTFLRTLVCALSLGCAGSFAQWLPARLTDPGDGMLDLSEHLLEHRGILPVPIVITEPAVGYGGGLVGIFFDKPLGDALKTSLGETGKAVPPNITAVGALGTENGTRGAFIGHRHTWQADRYRYLGALGKVDARLDYYGPLGKPRAYQLDGVGLMQQFQARAGETDWFFRSAVRLAESEPRVRRRLAGRPGRAPLARGAHRSAEPGGVS